MRPQKMRQDVVIMMANMMLPLVLLVQHNGAVEDFVVDFFSFET